MSRILYIGNGDSKSTSLQRAHAIERLGHQLIYCNPEDPQAGVISQSIFEVLHFRTGYRFIQKSIRTWLKGILANAGKPDLVWMDSGEYFGPEAVELLKSLGCPVILYNLDDPTGKRDGARFSSLIKALPLYDLVVVVRPESKQECLQLGAKNVLQVFRSYDEVAHKPFARKEDIPEEYRSEVAFIGTWMRHEKRDEFLMSLINNNINVSIWGARWSKSPYWNKLSPYYKGNALSGRNYVAAMQGAKVCLGLLSKGNRDLHTQRSLEVPYAGGVFCAERTSEHMALYEEGKEALFWSDANECIEACKILLSNDEYRESVRKSGMARVRELKVGNEDICRTILEAIFEKTASTLQNTRASTF